MARRWSQPAWVAGILAGALASTHCSGQQSESPIRPAPTTSSSTVVPTPNETPSSTWVPDIDTPVAACATPVAAGPQFMRRLTNQEYFRSIQTVLGLGSADTTAINLVTEGFGNEASGLPITNVHLERFEQAARALADRALSDAGRRARLVDCELAGSDSCLQRFVESVGKQLFRRPLSAQRVQALMAAGQAAAADADGYATAKLSLAAMLVSPRFLYRVESASHETPAAGPAASQPASAGARTLDGYELATRLSYFIWGTTPDAALLASAEAGQLATPAGLETAILGMLSDERAREGLGDFVSGWLRLYDVAKVPRSEATYPEFTDAMRTSMLAETARFASDFVWSPNGSVLDMLTASYGYADSNLAGLYGLAPKGEALERVEFAPGDPRGGLLTQASLLTASVIGGELTAPILRGKYVRTQLLCTQPPPPPPNVPPVPSDPNLTIRERLNVHMSNPSCNACHVQLDPVGLAFEQYDLIGRYRTTGTKGEALTGEGVLQMGSKYVLFKGPRELAAAVAQSSDTASCVVKHLHSYAFGRQNGAADSCSHQNAAQAFQAGGYNFQRLVTALAASEEFRTVSTANSATP